MAPSPHDAFPRGTYVKYKRATSYFLTWLLRARSGVGMGASTTPPSLDVYDRIVTAIASSPATSLSPALLQRLPHALAACASAITLRTRVALFFGDAADPSHAHFLDRLTHWLAVLSTVGEHCLQLDTDKTAEAHATTRAFASFYHVLALPDDYFADDENDENDTDVDASLPLPSVSKADRKTLQDDAFGDDFHTELACLFMELDELSGAVYATFLEVKQETKTLVDATAVAKVAIDSAASLIASMQLRYPALRDGNDLSRLIQDRLSLEQMSRLVATVQTAWQPSDDATAVRHQYVPGTVLVDIVGIVRVVQSLATKTKSRLPSSGERYDEATTRYFVVPQWGHLPPFFTYHVPKLLNLLVELREHKLQLTPDTLEAWLLAPFDTFSKTGHVSIHLVFICVCWIRSVAALQGNRGLARTVSVSILHVWELQQRLRDSMMANRGRGHFPEQTEALYTRIEAMDVVSPHMRVNPLLAGCIMLDHDVQYLTLGHDALMLSLFRPFCHIYSALRDRHLIDEIPFIEDAIHVYEATVFTPSRATATPGTFARSFLASHHLMEANVVLRRGNRQTPSRPGQVTSVVEKGRLMFVSHVVRLLRGNDFSVLPSGASVSWRSLLSAVADVCTKELVETRVLSRDVLKLSDDLTEMFESICDVMDRRGHVDRMAATSSSYLRALETAVVFPLLPLLDTLTNDASSRVDGRSLDLCRQAAAIISSKFGRAAEVERAYFTFPATPAWVTTAFGEPKPTVSNKTTVSVMEEFMALLNMLKTSPSPLRGNDVREFKRRVLAKPDVLAMMYPDPTDQLSTLLHHAAAGPARDLMLTEWLIQMGALEKELPYCRNPELLHTIPLPEGFALEILPNALAVHCAAKKGYSKTVHFMLDAIHFRDINAKTFHTKESLAQIAVQTGDQALWAWLVLHGGKCSGIDAAGNHIWDYTSDRTWRAKLKQVVAFEKNKTRRKPTKRTNGSTRKAQRTWSERTDKCKPIVTLPYLMVRRKRHRRPCVGHSPRIRFHSQLLHCRPQRHVHKKARARVLRRSTRRARSSSYLHSAAARLPKRN